MRTIIHINDFTSTEMQFIRTRCTLEFKSASNYQEIEPYKVTKDIINMLHEKGSYEGFKLNFDKKLFSELLKEVYFRKIRWEKKCLKKD